MCNSLCVLELAHEDQTALVLTDWLLIPMKFDTGVCDFFCLKPHKILRLIAQLLGLRRVSACKQSLIDYNKHFAVAVTWVSDLFGVSMDSMSPQQLNDN